MTASSSRTSTPRSVSRPGGSLHVLDYAGAEPAIVAMHGFPDDLHIYDYLIDHLAPRRVVTFDWLGYGRSARRQGGSFNPADRQRDLTAVLDGLGLDQVVLVGHDASGPEAVDFALAQPGRVRAVVLLNTYYGHDRALRFPEIIALMADPAYRALTDALLGDELQRLWLLQHSGRQMGLDPGDPAGIGTASIVPQFFGGEACPDALAEIRAWTADLPNALDRQDRRITAGELTVLTVPVTVAFGIGDQYLNPDLARHLASLFGHSRLHLVDGATHWPQWQQPEIVAGLIGKAVAGCGGRR